MLKYVLVSNFYVFAESFDKSDEEDKTLNDEGL